MANRHRYQENLIQWIWENLEFDVQTLETTDGEPVKIVNQGTKNGGDGPDFLNAQLIIDDMEWYGSVEIHVDAKDWNAHHHERDALYNGVILHVVLENPDHRVYTHSGDSPKTIFLKRFLNKNLNNLLARKSNEVLPCGGHVSFINQTAFEKQIEKAHREYFEYKVSELNDHYNPQLTPSLAWKHSLIKQMYDTFGIPSNRTPMRQLFDAVSGIDNMHLGEEAFISCVYDCAFRDNKIEWMKGGVRPLNSPEVRVKQAAAYHYAIESICIREFLRMGVASWSEIEKKVSRKYKPGKQRSQILEATVFLPAIYYLGSLFHSNKLMKTSFEIWKVDHFGVPQKILKPFKEVGYDLHKGVTKLGLAHQYKRYCLRKECNRCDVFKSAIRS